MSINFCRTAFKEKKGMLVKEGKEWTEHPGKSWREERRIAATGRSR